MKLLFDQNISHKLVERLSDQYPDSQHVREIGLKETVRLERLGVCRQARLSHCFQRRGLSSTEFPLRPPSKSNLGYGLVIAPLPRSRRRFATTEKVCSILLRSLRRLFWLWVRPLIN